MTSVFLEVIYNGTAESLKELIYEILSSDLNLYDLPLPDKVQVRGKYNEFIPEELLKKQLVEDYLDFEGLKKALL